MLPAFVGHEFECPQNWNFALDGLQAGNFTKAGVETAFWDLAAQIRNQPLHASLGGVAKQVESGLAVGLYDDLTDMLRTIERYLVDGYRRVKVKIEPGRDIERGQGGPKRVRRHSAVRGRERRLHAPSTSTYSAPSTSSV